MSVAVATATTAAILMIFIIYFASFLCWLHLFIISPVCEVNEEKKPDQIKVRLFKKSELSGRPDNPPPFFRLRALADCGWSRSLLLGTGAKGKSSCRKCDNCCDFGDSHYIFRLLSMLVACI